MTPTTPAPRRRRRRNRDLLGALVFLAPLAVIYGVYYLFSIGFLAQTSFTKVSISFFNSLDVGWRNFELLLSDPVFGRAILNTLIFAGVGVIASLTIAFFIAIALSTGVRSKKLLYTIFLLPTLMPVSLIATIFGAMLQERFGAVNQTLRAIGLGDLAQPWLTDPGLAFASIAVLCCYLIGLPILYYTADISALPTEALEAALIDGAGAFRIMRSIIYPMMRATHITVILALILGSFRAFEIVLFTTQGGPNSATEIAGTFLYGFTANGGSSIGLVSAAAIMVLLVALIISVIQMIVLRERKPQ